MKKALILAGAMMAAVPAFAEWTYYVSTDTDDFYYDASSVRVEGTMRRVWVLTDYKEPTELGDKSSRRFMQLDCKEERWRVIQATFFKRSMASGDVSTVSNVVRDWHYIGPETPPQVLMKMICR